MSLRLEVFGSEFDLARLQLVHVSDGESMDSTGHTSFHLDRQEIKFIKKRWDFTLATTANIKHLQTNSTCFTLVVLRLMLAGC